MTVDVLTPKKNAKLLAPGAWADELCRNASDMLGKSGMTSAFVLVAFVDEEGAAQLHAVAGGWDPAKDRVLIVHAADFALGYADKHLKKSGPTT